MSNIVRIHIILLCVFANISLSGKCDTLPNVIEIDSICYATNDNWETAFIRNKGTTKHHIVLPDSIYVEFTGNNVPVTNVSMAGNNELISIRLSKNIKSLYRSFENCKNLNYIDLHGVETIHRYTFEGCESLKKCTVPECVKEIYGELKLDTLILESSEHPIVFFPESRCVININTIIVGRDIQAYESVVIYLYFPIENIIVADDTDCSQLFFNCYFRKSIKTLTIGKNVKSYPMNCTGWAFEKLTLEDPIPGPCPGFTEQQYRTLVVNVPDEALEDYRNAEGWKNFVCLYGSGVKQNTLTGQKCEIARYDLYGRAVDADYQGVVVIRYSDGSIIKTVSSK